MRMIDADALKEIIKGHHDLYVNAWGGFKNLPANDKARVDAYSCCMADVVNAPSIDAAPVVRCGDCKWYDSAFYACSKCGVCVNRDFFCADGEKGVEKDASNPT